MKLYTFTVVLATGDEVSDKETRDSFDEALESQGVADILFEYLRVFHHRHKPVGVVQVEYPDVPEGDSEDYSLDKWGDRAIDECKQALERR